MAARTAAAPVRLTFAAALEAVRARFPLPVEQVERVDVDDVDEILAGVRSMRGGADAWARRGMLLPRRCVSLLFPALLRTEEPDPLARIHRMLEVRATPSLHELGWVWFQNHPDDPRVAEGFRIVHEALLQRDPVHCAKLPPGDGGPVDGTLPARIHARMKEERVERVDPYFESYGILPASPFARAILALYFASCPDAGFVRNLDAFARCLPGLDAAGGLAVLGHYLREHRLGPMFRPLNQAVLDAIGAPDSGHPAWTDVPEKTRARFWKWMVTRAVEDHLADNPRKFSLLLRYVPYMESVRALEEGILVMGFGSFYLVDDKHAPHITYYYEKAVFELWLETLAIEQAAAAEAEAAGEAPALVPEIPDPAFYGEAAIEPPVPSLPVQPARRVIIDQIQASAVLVDYQEVGLLYARDFLDDALRIGRRSGKGVGRDVPGGPDSKDAADLPKRKAGENGTPVGNLF